MAPSLIPRGSCQTHSCGQRGEAAERSQGQAPSPEEKREWEEGSAPTWDLRARDEFFHPYSPDGTCSGWHGCKTTVTR